MQDIVSPTTPEINRPSRANRAAALVLFGCALLGAAVMYLNDPTQTSWLPPCVIHQLTGLYCPGCGAGRATHQLLHGNLAAALALNPLYVLFVPYLLYSAVRGFFEMMFGLRLPHWRIEGRIPWWVLVAVVVLFYILRNVPMYPFTLLAPHGPGA